MEFDKNDPDYKSPVCIRGGPKRGNKNYLDMLTKDMEVTVLPYEKGHVDLLDGIDYKTWPHSHLAVVSKSKAIMMINEAENFAKSIDNAGLDYKLPLTDFFGGGQNSNTIAKYVVENVWDLNFKLPTYSAQPDIQRNINKLNKLHIKILRQD